ncbi:MAG TPA: amino acid aminotransferase [Rhizomicrobium sp.]|jgi:aromatic-amino-acid transaminase
MTLPQLAPDHGLFSHLQPSKPDPLLSLIAEFKADPREDKIDLGVGVYQDESGITPVMDAVKRAEQMLVDRQESKSYLGLEGDVGYVEHLAPLISRLPLKGVQTPGGTGALRLASDLIAYAKPGARVWLGTPTWPNHEPVFKAAGLTVKTYRHYDPATQTLAFDEMREALKTAQEGDIVLLHASCHNPTGADFSSGQWTELAALIGLRGLVPLIDFAYQGLGRGFAEDAAGLNAVLAQVDEALLAYSCDKNFGLYRDRVGALFVMAPDSATVYSNILAIARPNWSMPPDHGAAVVRTILESDELSEIWRIELDGMRARIHAIRKELAAADPFFAALAGQNGMFGVLPLPPARIARLKIEHGIYMAGSGRINLTGLRGDGLTRFANAVTQG